MSLFAVSCGSGDESAGPRTRNAGSEATIEACQESWGTVITSDEENQLLADLAAAAASLEVAKSTFLEDTEIAKQKLQSLDMVAFNANLRKATNPQEAIAIQAEGEKIAELPDSWDSVVAAFKKVIEIEQILLLANVINPSGADDIITTIIENSGADNDSYSYSSADSAESAIDNYDNATNEVESLEERAQRLEGELALLANEAAQMEADHDAARDRVAEWLAEQGIELDEVEGQEMSDEWVNPETGETETYTWVASGSQVSQLYNLQDELIAKAFGGQLGDGLTPTQLYEAAGGPGAQTDANGDTYYDHNEGAWGSTGLQFILDNAGDNLTEQERSDLIDVNNLNDAITNSDTYYSNTYYSIDDTQRELDDVLLQMDGAEEAAENVQTDGVEGFSPETDGVTQMGLDPCEQLKEDILAEGVVKLLSALQSVLAEAPSAMPVSDINKSVDETEVIASAAAAEDSDDGDDGVSVVVSAYQVSVEDDEQVQIPTMVMLADNATVEIEEIVSEIVITPAAAEQMMINAGVSQGSVVVKSDGEWQVIDLESIVIPVSSDSNAVEIRVVPSEPSQPVVAQTVALKRTPVQQLLTAEQFAAAIAPLSSNNDSSGLIWVLYVVIVVLALGVAFIFVQRRKSMGTN
jgi:hypothetical protein